MQSMVINMLLVIFYFLIISVCPARTTLTISRIWDIGPRKVLSEVGSILYLLLVLPFRIILNGGVLMRVWDRKMLILSNMLNPMYEAYKIYLMENFEELLVQLNILLEMDRQDMVRTKVKPLS